MFVGCITICGLVVPVLFLSLPVDAQTELCLRLKQVPF